MARLRRYGLAIAFALLPTSVVRPLANLTGHRIRSGARIGFSLLLAEQIALDSGARIGHFSLIGVRRLVMRRGAVIGHLNRLAGPFSMWLEPRSAIGTANTVTRNRRRGTVTGPALFRLGALSKITAHHFIDITCSVRFGDFTILAGRTSQIWTHGYVHDIAGEGRYRVDASVSLGNNVYVGSAAVITGGVSVADGAIIGAGVSLGKSVDKPGLYVSSGLRHLPRPADPARRDNFRLVTDPELIETVYVKCRARD